MTYSDIIKDIKDKKELRQSFNQLAEKIFEINFEEWYQAGYWGDNYITYSMIEKQQIIANASVTVSEMVIGDKFFKTAQIGTVMTEKDYRGKGLSKKIIEEIIKEYKNQVDFIYLFANETVLEFYPKFDFQRVDELCVEVDVTSIESKTDSLEKISFMKHQKMIEDLAQKRNTIHLNSYLIDSYNLTMFYYSTVFSEGISYINNLNCYVCFEVDGNELHLFDCLSDKEIDISEVLSYLPIDEVDKVYCHFSLSDQSLMKEVITIPSNEDALFVLGIEPTVLNQFKLPLFNHA